MSNSVKSVPLLKACKKVTVGHVGTTSKHYADEGITFIRTQNVTNMGLDLHDVRCITNEFHQSIQKSSVEPGDLLLTRVVTDEMKSIIVPENIGQANCANVILIRPDKDLISEYLCYLIYSPQSQEYLLGKRVGAAQQVVNTKILKDWVIDIPSITEQKRIVAILDQAFAEIDKARAHAQQNLNNTRELFESYLQQVFSQRGDGWEVKPLESFSNIVNGFSFKSGDFCPNNEVKSIKITNVGVYEFVEESNNHLPKKFLNEYGDRYSAYAGDIVVALTRTIISLGLKVAVVPATYDGALINQRVAAIQINEDIMPKEILQAFLSTRIATDYVRSKVNELMQPNLSIKDLKTFPVPVPPKKKKLTVAREIAEIRQQTNQLINIYSSKINELDELKKSILQKVFSGQLLLNNTASSTVIPFPKRIPNINTTDLHAGIIAIAYLHHEEVGKEKQFGHVKAEKIAHMVEALLGIDLDRNPIQDAAGPNDYPHFKKKVEPRAKKAGFFEFIGNEASGYRLIKKGQFNKIVEKTRAALAERNIEIDNLIHSMVKMNTESAEIFATVYAAWNNLLLKKLAVTDESIVLAAREDWHESKLNISRDRFFKAIKWIRENEMEPKGQGKYVK